MRLKSKDIAKTLNISPSAVSLALNNKPGVSEETLRRVNTLVEEYYSNEKFAVDKKEAAQGKILLVIHKTQKQLITTSLFFRRSIEEMQVYATARGYSLEIVYYNDSLDERLFVKDMDSARVDGILLLATELTYEELALYRQVEKAFVLMDARFFYEDMDMVTLNNWGGTGNAVAYAFKNGHRKIGYLRSKTVTRNFEDRFCGYLDGLERFGLSYNEKYVYDVLCSTEGAYADMVKILARENIELPTIFLADIDHIAIGVMRALKERGYRVPEDISLIGFDNMEFAAALEPPLTTVGVESEIGRVALDRLIEKINRDDSDYLNIEIATKLIERGSVGRV